MSRAVPQTKSILAASLAAGLLTAAAAHAGTQLIANSSGLAFIDQESRRVLSATAEVKSSDGKSWTTSGLAKAPDGSY